MSALQQMAMNMFSDMIKNLPPDVQQKIGQISEFTAMLDRRLASLDRDMQAIKTHLGINDERTLDNVGRINGPCVANDGNGSNVERP